MIRVQEFQLRTLQLRTRIPFKYGIATMTEAPLLFCCLTAEMEGKTMRGVSSDCLPPKWFTKDPDKPLEAEISEMLQVISHAANLSLSIRAENIFSFWRSLYKDQDTWARSKNLPPLLAHFGTSLVERALIDGRCRHKGETFHEALRRNSFGFRVKELDPECPELKLRGQPLDQITVRHTIGLSDPLRDEDIPEPERLNDGLPQSLAEAAEAYKLQHFKIKVNGNIPHDLARLIAISETLGGKSFRYSLDGNEQFKSIVEFKAYWTELSSHKKLGAFMERLLFVEQPLHRSVALSEEVAEQFREWRNPPPIIIDESDATVEDGKTALRIGYAGMSHKNCKGVFKGLLNLARIQRLQAECPARCWIQSGEDLCNVGPVALLQDLAVMASLGIKSVERNGHHYHPGLSQFPKLLQDAALEGHGDVYSKSQAGWPTLNIREGNLHIGSVNRAPFGHALPVDAFEVVPAITTRP